MAFAAGAGLEVSGFEDIRVAIGLWSLGGLWGILAAITWPPVQRHIPFIKRRLAPTGTEGQPKDLRITVRGFIDGGRTLQVEVVTQGVQPPFAKFDHWRIEVRHFLEDNFEGSYSMEWQEAVSETARPKRGFTGMATQLQIELWNRTSSGVEWLEELERRI